MSPRRVRAAQLLTGPVEERGTPGWPGMWSCSKARAYLPGKAQAWHTKVNQAFLSSDGISEENPCSSPPDLALLGNLALPPLLRMQESSGSKKRWAGSAALSFSKEGPAAVPPKTFEEAVPLEGRPPASFFGFRHALGTSGHPAPLGPGRNGCSWDQAYSFPQGVNRHQANVALQHKAQGVPPYTHTNTHLQATLHRTQSMVGNL